MSDGADGLSLAGIIGGITTVATLMGSGVWRLLTRADRKAERLQEKEDALVAKLEKRVEALEEDCRKLWMVVNYVVPALHQHDPKSPALAHAVKILGDAFPLDLNTPADMTDTLGRIDRRRP